MYADAQGGDLLFASGNRFLMGDFMTGEVGFGIRWNVLENQYSVKPQQYPGSILAAGELIMREREQSSALMPEYHYHLRYYRHFKSFDMQKDGIELNLAQTSIFHQVFRIILLV